jgi:hypothetical protein
VVSAAEPPWSLISVFQTGAATFLSSRSSFILTRAEWSPFQTHCYSENLTAAGIEPGTSWLATRKSNIENVQFICQIRYKQLVGGNIRSTIPNCNWLVVNAP